MHFYTFWHIDANGSEKYQSPHRKVSEILVPTHSFFVFLFLLYHIDEFLSLWFNTSRVRDGLLEHGHILTQINIVQWLSCTVEGIWYVHTHPHHDVWLLLSYFSEMRNHWCITDHHYYIHCSIENLRGSWIGIIPYLTLILDPFRYHFLGM